MIYNNMMEEILIYYLMLTLRDDNMLGKGYCNYYYCYCYFDSKWYIPIHSNTGQLNMKNDKIIKQDKNLYVIVFIFIFI